MSVIELRILILLYRIHFWNYHDLISREKIPDIVKSCYKTPCFQIYVGQSTPVVTNRQRIRTECCFQAKQISNNAVNFNTYSYNEAKVTNESCDTKRPCKQNYSEILTSEKSSLRIVSNRNNEQDLPSRYITSSSHSSLMLPETSTSWYVALNHCLYNCLII